MPGELFLRQAGGAGNLRVSLYRGRVERQQDAHQVTSHIDDVWPLQVVKLQLTYQQKQMDDR